MPADRQMTVHVRLEDDQMDELRGQVQRVAEQYAGEVERLRAALQAIASAPGLEGQPPAYATRVAMEALHG